MEESVATRASSLPRHFSAVSRPGSSVTELLSSRDMVELTKAGTRDAQASTGSFEANYDREHGGYRINYDKVRTYVVPPNLSTFKVGVQFLQFHESEY